VPDVIDFRTRTHYYSLESLHRFRTNRYRRDGQPDQQSFNGLRFIDLFAGIGGMHRAFERAGANCVFSSEIDLFACTTYQANFHTWPAGDITKIHAGNVPEHDILVAGFPCQPFSIAGVSKYGSLGREHGFKDETKGTLFFDIVRLLDYHRPKAFMLENVKNLQSHDKGKTWQVISRALDELGYIVHSRVLDAKLLVPQHRERIFILGFRDSVPFGWPEIPDLKPQVREILEEHVDDKYTLSDHLWSYLQSYARKHREKGNGYGYGLADSSGITRTLSARYYKDGSEILIPQEGKNPRRLTPRECARLMGYPDSFRIPVSDTQAYRQFGNSVVVPLVGCIASALVSALTGEERTLPTQQLQLLERS